MDSRLHTSRRGFTLVELLVVIGIIALLISILLPSLNKARQAANTVACGSNMRQVGQAFNMYAGAYKGMLPMGAWRQSDWRQITWDDQIHKFLGGSRPEDDSWNADPNLHGLWGPYTSTESVRVLRCPNDTFARTVASQAIRSYAVPNAEALTAQRYHGMFAGSTALAPTAADWPTAVHPNFRHYKITEARAAAETLLMVEYHRADNIAGYTPHATIGRAIDQFNTASTPREPVHNRRFNYLFVDGHVEALHPRDTATNMFAYGPYQGKYWTRERD